MPQKAAHSQVTQPEKRKFSEFILTFMIMSIESDYDVICGNDQEGHIFAIRNGQQLKVDIVTGEEIPAPDYDEGKCPNCNSKTNADPDSESKPKPVSESKSKSKSDSDSVPDSDYDYFILRWK